MQSIVQLNVDICVKHIGLLEGLRTSRREGVGDIRCCRGIGDDDLCALFTSVAFCALRSLRLECFSFTMSCGKSTKSSGGSGDLDWWITTFFEDLVFLVLTSWAHDVWSMDAFLLTLGLVDDMVGADEVRWGMRMTELGHRSRKGKGYKTRYVKIDDIYIDGY